MTHARKPYPRHVRVASRLRDEAARWFHMDADAPWNAIVTVTRVEVTRDLSYADIWLLTHEDRDAEALMAYMRENVGQLRRHLARSLRLKKLPRAHVHYDEPFAKAAEVASELADLNPEHGATRHDDGDT